jgi:hypothetical protein
MTTNAQIAQALLTLTPTAQWNLLGDNYADIEWLSPEIPEPTQEQLDAQIVIDDQQAPLNACKQQASRLLYETDWTTIPDVANTANNPYLLNQSAFIAYRNDVRKLAVNPVANPVFPVIPTAQWGT